MPKFPTDMKKCRAATERNRNLKAKRAKAKAENDAKTDAALAEVRRKFAEQRGVPESEVTMIVCRRGRR